MFSIQQSASSSCHDDPVSDPSLALSIGSADISQESIDSAVQFLIQSTAQAYLDTLSKSLEEYRRDPSHFDTCDFACYFTRIKSCSATRLPQFTVAIPHDRINENRSGEARYQASFNFTLNEMDNESPLGTLVVSLSQRISDLGFPCSEAVVRLEKGCFVPEANDWHVDGPAANIAIAVCYSSRSCWSTRILDPTMGHVILKTRGSFEKNQKAVEALYTATLEQLKQIESASKPARIGFLYNVKEIPHRSPKASDLSHEDKLDVDDYRLFMLFS
jgi:hypothetical protein